MNLETGLLLWVIISVSGITISLLTLIITIEKFYVVRFSAITQVRKDSMLRLLTKRLVERSFRFGFFTVSLFAAIVRYYEIRIMPNFILYLFLLFSSTALIAMFVDLYYAELRRRKVFRYVRLNAKKY